MRPFACDVPPAERSTRFRGWWRTVLPRVVILAIVVSATPAQADISASASLNAQNAQVGQAVTLSIELKGAQNVEAPALTGLDDFEAQYVGPSTQVSIVNGQMSASVQHRYALTPKRAGRFILGPFTVEYGGQQYQTNRLQLTVAQPSTAPGAPAAGAPAGDRLRVVLTVPKTEVYFHEVLPMEVTLYVGALQVSDVQYPTVAAEGLSIEPFGQPRQFSQMIEGQRWDIVQFHTSVIPVQAGTRPLGPATQRLNVIERQRQGGMFNDPFFNAFTSRRRPMEVRSDVVELTVLPLPEEGKPASFNGAIGRFELSAAASPAEVSAGDPITLRMVLQGSGNLTDARPPQLLSTDGFKVYDPQVSNADAGALRVFEQVLIPNGTAVTSIPTVRFSYFDPEARQYRTTETAPIAISVRPPEGGSETRILAADGERRIVREQLGRDIVYIKDDIGSTHRGSDASYGSWLFLAWQPIPLLLLGGAILYDRHRRRLSGDLRYARFMQAKRHARQGLDRADEALKASQPAAFYDHLSRAMQDYVADKLGLPPGAVDPAVVEQSGVSAETAVQLRELFAAWEQVRFAPAAADGDMRGLLVRAKAIVDRLERECRSVPAQGLG